MQFKVPSLMRRCAAQCEKEAPATGPRLCEEHRARAQLDAPRLSNAQINSRAADYVRLREKEAQAARELVALNTPRSP